MFLNSKISCSSKQVYANRRGGYVEATDGSVIKSMVMPEGSHISDVGVCKDWGEVKKGDKMKVIAYYDDKTHMQMRDQNGKLEKQMGMIWVCICCLTKWRRMMANFDRFIWVSNRSRKQRWMSTVHAGSYIDASV